MRINNLFSIRVYQFNRIPVAVGIGTNRGVFIGQWVNAQPHGHQFVVHIAGTEISVAGFLVALFASENIAVKPYVFCTVYPFGFMCCTVH